MTFRWAQASLDYTDPINLLGYFYSGNLKMEAYPQPQANRGSGDVTADYSKRGSITLLNSNLVAAETAR